VCPTVTPKRFVGIEQKSDFFEWWKKFSHMHYDSQFYHLYTSWFAQMDMALQHYPSCIYYDTATKAFFPLALDPNGKNHFSV